MNSDKIFKALSDKNRRKIIGLLMKKNYNVNGLLYFFNISQPTLSSHLTILKKSGLVGVVKQGRKRVYLLNKKLLQEFAMEIFKFAELIITNKSVGFEDIKIRSV